MELSQTILCPIFSGADLLNVLYDRTPLNAEFLESDTAFGSSIHCIVSPTKDPPLGPMESDVPSEDVQQVQGMDLEGIVNLDVSDEPVSIPARVPGALLVEVDGDLQTSPISQLETEVNISSSLCISLVLFCGCDSVCILFRPF